MRHFKTLMTVLLLAGLSSCTDADTSIKENDIQFSRLRVAVDPEANFYLDSISISSDYKFKFSNYSEYDSLLDQLVFVFDSVEHGSIDLTVVSFLNRTYDKNISFQSDTTIFIPRSDLDNFTDDKANKLTSLNLNEGDTIVIGLSSSGCFQFLKENVIVSKKHKNYDVAFNTTRESVYGNSPMHLRKTFDSSFTSTLNRFFDDCKTLLKSRKNGKLICISTTTTNVVIRMGNTVYHLPEIGCGEWRGYDNLIKAIDPPWTKKNSSL
jgi:hypothetical protein